jgi:hypothetical protein
MKISVPPRLLCFAILTSSQINAQEQLPPNAQQTSSLPTSVVHYPVEPVSSASNNAESGELQDLNETAGSKRVALRGKRNGAKSNAGDDVSYKGYRSAVEYIEQVEAGPSRRLSEQERQELANVVFEAARWTAMHPKLDRPVEESKPLYQLLATNLPTIATLYDRFDVRLENLSFELEWLGFKDPNAMDYAQEATEREQLEKQPIKRYKSFTSAVAYIDHLDVGPSEAVSDGRLAELANTIFEAAKWTGQHPEYDFRLNQSSPIFQLLAKNLPPISTLSVRLDVRLRHLSVKLEELGFREKRKRFVLQSR